MLHVDGLHTGASHQLQQQQVTTLSAQQQQAQQDAQLYAAYQQQHQNAHQQQQLQVAPFNAAAANQMMMAAAGVPPMSAVGISLMTTKKRKQAACAYSVLGKVTVTDMPTGQKVSQWCGTECYLSYISGLGPCLVVRSSKHKRGDGTMFQLRFLEKVLSQKVEEGKLTIQIPHMKRKCMIFVDVTESESIPHLRTMANALDDPRRWADLEANIGRGMNSGAGTRRGRPSKGQVIDGEEGEVLHTNKEARDAVLAQDDEDEFEFA